MAQQRRSSGPMLTFSLPAGHVDCCCWRILFVSQKPQLQELIESHVHICNFYPKYHCELNFITQYWEAAKLHFHMVGHAATIEEMERKVINCLDDVSLLYIQQCVFFFF